MNQDLFKSKLKLSVVGLGLCAGLFSTSSHAFCGFYVGKADSTLFNEASQVILARDGNKNVISMLNDYKGDLKEFALVVPVPTVLQKDQIHVGDKSIFDRLDAYSAPRLAEYFDDNPCERRRYEMEKAASAPMALMDAAPRAKGRSFGVTVEATYTVGEYDIVILSAKQSDGLETWLKQNGYKIPPGASKALKPYINQNLKFFVAKVNLKEQAKTGFQTLRPLQFAYEYERFMLPIRLGMANANGPQDLIAYIMTKNGRVESSNYRTVKLPANMDIPIYIKNDFKGFYKAMFDLQAKKEDYRTVFTEYFWDMSWCDPCASEPLSQEELRKAGVFWVNGSPEISRGRGGFMSGGAQPVMLTRLHVRYTKETFPEDLMFTETRDRENFQARYVLRNPWTGSKNQCPEAKQYFKGVRERQKQEAKVLANLTGWSIDSIRAKMNIPQESNNSKSSWWNNLWN